MIQYFFVIWKEQVCCLVPYGLLYLQNYSLLFKFLINLECELHLWWIYEVYHSKWTSMMSWNRLIHLFLDKILALGPHFVKKSRKSSFHLKYFHLISIKVIIKLSTINSRISSSKNFLKKSQITQSFETKTLLAKITTIWLPCEIPFQILNFHLDNLIVLNFNV